MTKVNEQLNVVEKDVGGKLFDTVSRYKLKSTRYEIFIDINTDLFPLETNEVVELLLTKTLNRDETKMNLEEGYTSNFGKRTIMDDYDYVMSGKIFKFVEDKKKDKLAVIASFGGLLLMIYGNPNDLSYYSMGDDVFVLIKRKN